MNLKWKTGPGLCDSKVGFDIRLAWDMDREIGKEGTGRQGTERRETGRHRDEELREGPSLEPQGNQMGLGQILPVSF